MQWFCPKPYKVTECEIDFRPGGRFWNVIESPEGARFPGEACYSEVIENRRLVWTSALLNGFRPKAQFDAESETNVFGFTAIIDLVPHGSGTTYKASVVHATKEDRAKHEAMGFETGGDWHPTNSFTQCRSTKRSEPHQRRIVGLFGNDGIHSGDEPGGLKSWNILWLETLELD